MDFIDYITHQILLYLDDFHIVGDKEEIREKIASTIPSFIRDIKKVSQKDEIKIIQKNWHKLSNDKKLELLGDLGDLDNFFANLIYQKSLKYPGLKQKYRELFEESSEFEPSEKEKKPDLKELKVDEQKDEKSEEKKEKDLVIFKPKKDEFSQNFLGVKSGISDLKHEIDEFSIFRDYAVDDKSLDQDPPMPDDYVTEDKTSYDNTNKKPKSMNRKKL